MFDRVYVILHNTRKEAYIGRTYRLLVDRWAEHLKAAADGNTSKTLYERMRHEPDAFDILECEYSATASEAEWIERFKADGFEILNDTGGNRSVPKKRDDQAGRAWREMNFDAEQRLNSMQGDGASVHARLAKITGAGAWARFAAANPEYEQKLDAAIAGIR